MAKKRGRRKNRRESPVAHELPGGFWRQVVAILMLAGAVFSVVTWFGHGGTILNEIHKWMWYLIGAGIYLVPLLMIYLAVKIFRSHDNRVAVAIWLASMLIIVWVAGIFGIWHWGGMLGEGLNKLLVQFLDRSVVIFIYIIMIFITALFILQLSPLTVLKGTRNLVRSGRAGEKKRGEGEGRMGAKKLRNLEIKVNSGVMMEQAAREPIVKKPMPAVAVAPTEERALVEVSDPNWKMPDVDMLEKKQSPADAGNVQQNAMIIKNTLAEFGIDVEMEGANVGPSVTQYTMRAPTGVNLSKISAREKELTLRLAAKKTVRVEAPIPGTQLIGVEVPNVKSASVGLRNLLESEEWKKKNSPLKFAIGKNMSGKAVVGDLADMRHLLIAGTTGSGKSVMLNTVLMSMLFHNSPSDLKMIIVDVKKVEMEAYKDIPHLLTPIVNDEIKAVSALKWAVGEMQRRYTAMQEAHVKNIAEYNKKKAKEKVTIKDKDGNMQEHKGGKMPYIVIVIDEMAQVMMMAAKELEPSIVSIAQLGRAAGMHLILATQRPVVKVITGLIKSNIPSRISFRVLTSMDSRVMLDVSGAEKLVGKGDMLLSTEDNADGLVRIQGAWTSDKDIYQVTDFLREQRAPEYNDEIVAQPVQIKGVGPTDGGAMGDLGRRYDPNDPTVRKAVEISLAKGKFSTAMLQTYLGKGHGFVSGLALWFEEIGVIGPANGNRPRDILITSMDEFDNLANM